MSIYDNHKYPWLNTHGLNLDWVIQTVKDAGLATEDLDARFDLKADITYVDQQDALKTDKTTTTALASEVDNQGNQIQYLYNQFQDGQTGLVIDGGFFGDDDINKNYDGGTW